MVGHGGIVAFDDTVDMAAMARYAMEFCAIESCGKCTPCRIGSIRGRRSDGPRHRRADRGDPAAAAASAALLKDLCDTMLARLAVRDGRHGAVPGAERAAAFP